MTKINKNKYRIIAVIGIVFDQNTGYYYTQSKIFLDLKFN